MRYTEEYIIENADTFNWEHFECDMNIYSKEFVEQFKSEIIINIWKNSKGKYHRTDGPAIESIDGHKEWWVNGQRHREDGPSFVCNLYQEWFFNGRYHRIDGPSITYINGKKEWFLNGKRHRRDGPAVESNGYRAWFINGEELTKREFYNKKF